jgi:uncharacterized MAPEG superfamily protein
MCARAWVLPFSFISAPSVPERLTPFEPELTRFFLSFRSFIAVHITYPSLPYALNVVYADVAETKANPAAMRFNCAQRAHQNTLEVMPHTLFTILFAGLRYPTLATALGSLWVFGRVIYTMGYATGDPDKVCKVSWIRQMWA